MYTDEADMAIRAQVTGEVSRLPEPSKVGGLYLHLSHGRVRADEALNDWGFEGPKLGPLEYVHITYASDVKFEFETHEDAKKFGFDEKYDIMIDFIEGLFPFHGGFYGDIIAYVFDGHSP